MEKEESLRKKDFGPVKVSRGNGEISSGGSILNIKSKDGQWDNVTALKGEASAKISAAKVTTSISKGIASLDGEVDVLSLEAKAESKVVLVEKGKLAPQIAANVEIEGNVAKGSLEGTLGNEYIDAHIKGKGELGHAHAKAGAGIGKVTYKDDDGKQKTVNGAYVEVGAEAYAAKGSISGGVTICGIKVDVELEGKAGGAGAKADAKVDSGGIKAGLGLGLLAGLGLDVSIDWTEFKWPRKKKKAKTVAAKNEGGSGTADMQIYPEKLKADAQALQDASKQISRLAANVDKIKGAIQMNGVSAAIIKGKLGEIIKDMQEEKNNIKKMAEALTNISQKYIEAENRIKTAD